MYSHPEESNYMKKLLTITKRERGRDKIESTGNGKVPKIRLMGKLLPVNG
jgi:hypothetical protein